MTKNTASVFIQLLDVYILTCQKHKCLRWYASKFIQDVEEVSNNPAQLLYKQVIFVSL
jgi:hypothetical protein